MKLEHIVLTATDGTPPIKNIKEELERYRNLAQISTDWFWETDENYTIIYMSDSVERITGFSKDKYIGIKRYELASEETKLTVEWQNHIAQVAHHEPIKNFEYKHVGTDGRAIYLRVNAIPLFNKNGEFRGYMGSTSDISELVLAKMRVEEINSELQSAKEAAEELARTDVLTGLHNRRAFFEHGMAIDDMSRRYGQNYSIIMMDIDHFKTINDNFGHAAGDMTIKAVANIVTMYARTSDVPGRIGGEEFAIILPQTLIDNAGNLAERLRRSIEQKRIPLKQRMLSFTASFGVAQCCNSSQSVDNVLTLADQALYQAKSQGRNRVIMMENSIS